MGSLSRRLLVPLLLLVAGASSPVTAATNLVTAGIGGVDNGTMQNGDGSGPARITINSVPLALVKQARDANGIVLPDGAGVVPGQEIYFVLYLDNPTPFPSADLRITDALDEAQFVYVPGSIEETVVPSGSNDAAVWTGTWAPLTDTVGTPDDVASIVDTGGAGGLDHLTIGAVSGRVNRTVTLPGNSLLAIRFRVRVF